MNTNEIRSFVVRGMLAIAALAVMLGIFSPPSLAQSFSGDVYVLTNQTTGNYVKVYHRFSNGSLLFANSIATGGSGTGTGADPLASQGALVLDQDHRLLFAANAGSNNVSVFAVNGDNLSLLNKVPSDGTKPVSIGVYGNLVYVLNAGGTPNITGFTINPSTNYLAALSGSTRNLPGGSPASPAQVSFSLDGGILMVTEKGTSKIDTYTVDVSGHASLHGSYTSSGTAPFGFAFTHHDYVIVSEAGPDALSSYEVDENGDLELVTGSLGDGQAATCWAVVTDDGLYAYAANAGTNNISLYGVSDGALTLLDATAGTTGTGSTPTDMALSADSHFLYVRDGGNGKVSGFQVNGDGSLTPVGFVSGIGSDTQGIAAR
ncbi:MAG: lactonase family protein [Terriglobia bacterium]